MTNWTTNNSTNLTGFPDKGPVISTLSGPSMGGMLTHSTSGIANAIWGLANRAVFVPFRISRQMVCTQMFIYVAVQNGNMDIGLYDEFGTRLVSMGATACPAAGSATFNIADTTIGPGIFYFALVFDGIVASVGGVAFAANFLKLGGVAQMAVAYPLPATAVFATPTETRFPVIGVTERSFV